MAFSKMRDFFRSIYRKRGAFYFLYRSLHEPSYPLLCLHWARWNAWAFFSKKPLVHFIGDSHTSPFNFQPRFLVHHIGQATAHNLASPQSTSGSGQILSTVLSRINHRRDVLALVFGEIDCRIHFHYQHEKSKKPLAQLIGETVSNYGSVVLQLKNAGFRVCVLSASPAARQQNIYNYPYYGTPQQRSAITRQFNAALQSFCAKNGVPFIDAHSQFADQNGFMPPQYARDEVHFNQKICPFVRDELNKAFSLDL